MTTHSPARPPVDLPQQRGATPLAQASPPEASPRRPGRTALVVALGVVVLLAVGFGTAWSVAWLARGPAPDGSGLKVAWSLPYPGKENRADEGADGTFGGWLTDQAVVRTQRDGVVAYKLADGAPAWSTPSPEGMSLCAATQSLHDGLGAVAYGTADACDTVAGLDASTGKLTWQTKVAMPRTVLSANRLHAPHLHIAGGVVTVQLGGDKVVAYGLSDGKQKWQWAPNGAGCHLVNTRADDTTVVVVTECSRSNQATAFDANTGKVRWESKLDKQWPKVVLSVQPTVVCFGLEKDDFSILDDNGKPVGGFKNPLEGTKLDLQELERRTTDGLKTYRSLVHNRTLYLQTAASYQSDAKSGTQVKVIAIDLATGQRRWESSGHANPSVKMIRADDHGVLAWEFTRYGKSAPRLIRIAADTGKATVLATAPVPVGKTDDVDQIFVQSGTVVIVARERSGLDRAIVVLR